MSVVSGAGFSWQLQLIETAKIAGVKTFVPSEFGFPLDHIMCALCYKGMVMCELAFDVSLVG